jgi:hypothetical protein
VVGAVSCEPVSGPILPVYREFTGKNAEIRTFLSTVSPKNASAAGGLRLQFPGVENREIPWR